MAKRYRVKPSRAISLVAMLSNIAALVIGLVFVFPRSTEFGAIWCIVSGIGAIFFAVNYFTKEGISTHVIERDDD